MKPIDSQIQSYLEHCELKALAKNTMIDKRKVLRMFAKIVDKPDMQEVTNTDIDHYQKYLLTHNCNERTVNAWTLHVKAFMTFCEVYLELSLKVNRRRIERLKAPALKRRAFSPQEIERVLNFTKDEREYLLIAIPFESGLRVNELANLKVENIYPGGVIELVGKGGRLRETYVTSNTYSMICDYAARHDEKGFLFPSRERGKHLSGNQIRFIQKEIFKRAGIDNFRPHMLRYSFATVITDNGADLISAQLMLGHSSLVITQRYLQRNSKRVREDHAKFMTYGPAAYRANALDKIRLVC